MRPLARQPASRRRLALGLALVLAAGALGLLASAAPAAAPALEREIARIAAAVERIRGLHFRRPARPVLLTSAGFGARARAITRREYRPRAADRDARLLAALGAIPPATDLRGLEAEAVTEQVAGFYDPRTKALVLRVRQAGALNGAERITLAHELDHALTDQVLDIPLPDDPELGNEDGNLAALALAEGDATLVMQRYSATLGLGEQFELLDPEAIAEAEAGLSGFPSYLEQELIFPYEEGLKFVCDLYANGGWEAVNAAYADPPASSDQILFPDRYRAEEEASLPRPAGHDPKPSASWQPRPVLEFGAANLLWLFEAPGGERAAAVEDPVAAAGEWAGGSITLWTRGADTALLLALVDRPGGGGLCETVGDWYSGVLPDDQETSRGTAELISEGGRQVAVVNCVEDEVRVGIGPTRDVAYRIVL
jgi:hypothetical protein